jgi:hypothetical protein
VHRRLRQEDLQFETSVDCNQTLLKKKKKKKKLDTPREGRGFGK